MPFTPTGSSELVPFLRQRVSRHNAHVVGFTILTAVGAVLLWAAAYGATYWLILFLLSAIYGGEAQPPAHWREWFWGIAAFLLGWAWLARWLRPDERARDRRYPTEIAVDILLLIPRITLAIWGNLSAWLRLSPPELQAAAALLDQVREARRIPFHSTPLIVPEGKLREHIIHALLLLDLAEIRKEDQVLWLKVAPGKDDPRVQEPSAPPPLRTAGRPAGQASTPPAPGLEGKRIPGDLWE